ncbi:MAG: Zn-binding domain-containing protein, partial [Candidatus Geothermincolales bacterium]
RGGYLPSLRREIERRLFSGELLGVSATNALELGIDVGDMEACIINGYPGTISSTWQQAGRAGRRTESLAVLVAGDDPLDQYLARNPEYLLGAPFEEAIVDLENENILCAHLLCAAHELPLKDGDERFFGREMWDLVDEMEKRGWLRTRAGRRFPTRLRSPSHDVSLRSSSGSTVDIVDRETGSVLGTVEEATSIFHVHPGAVYMQMGETYLVESLDLEKKIALVREADLEYYTNPLDNVDVRVLSEERTREGRGCSLHYGEVEVTTEVYAYQKRRLVSHEVLETVPLELPARVLPTRAFWLTLPPGRIGSLGLDEYELAGGLHAMEHAAIAMLPLFAMCDRWDIGGMSTSLHPDTGEATVFIYDAYPGGIGIAARGFHLVESHLKATRDMIGRCPCARGCPSCIQSPKCGSGNEPLHKEAAIRLLDLAISDLFSGGGT